MGGLTFHTQKVQSKLLQTAKLMKNKDRLRNSLATGASGSHDNNGNRIPYTESWNRKSMLIENWQWDGSCGTVG